MGKFTQLIKILHDRRSRRSRQISSLDKYPSNTQNSCCRCLVVNKRMLVLWWWWQWKRWQSTKRGTLAKQMPEWATDKQIVPPHTMIEEHCLQNAEDDTGRDVFCHLVQRMWTILSACCQYQYCRPPNPQKNCIPKLLTLFAYSFQEVYFVQSTPPPVPVVLDKQDCMMFAYSQSKIP